MENFNLADYISEIEYFAKDIIKEYTQDCENKEKLEKIVISELKSLLQTMECNIENKIFDE